MQSLHKKTPPKHTSSRVPLTSKKEPLTTDEVPTKIIQFTDEQRTKLQNIKNMFQSAKKVDELTNSPLLLPEKKVVDHNFYKTLAYISTIVFPIIGSYLQYYLYVIYVYLRRFFKKSDNQE